MLTWRTAMDAVLHALLNPAGFAQTTQISQILAAPIHGSAATAFWTNASSVMTPTRVQAMDVIPNAKQRFCGSAKMVAVGRCANPKTTARNGARSRWCPAQQSTLRPLVILHGLKLTHCV